MRNWTYDCSCSSPPARCWMMSDTRSTNIGCVSWLSGTAPKSSRPEGDLRNNSVSYLSLKNLAKKKLFIQFFSTNLRFHVNSSNFGVGWSKNVRRKIVTHLTYSCKHRCMVFTLIRLNLNPIQKGNPVKGSTIFCKKYYEVSSRMFTHPVRVPPARHLPCTSQPQR